MRMWRTSVERQQWDLYAGFLWKPSNRSNVLMYVCSMKIDFFVIPNPLLAYNFPTGPTSSNERLPDGFQPREGKRLPQGPGTIPLLESPVRQLPSLK